MSPRPILAATWLALASAGCASTVAGSAGERDAALADVAAVDVAPVDVVPAADVATRADVARVDAAASRCTGALLGWTEVDQLLGGDYERLVAADASNGAGQWLVGGGRMTRREAATLLHVEVVAGRARVVELVAVTGTEQWEPLALATDGATFVLVARGPDGEPLVARVDRAGRVLARATVEALRADARYRLEGDVAVRDDGLVVLAMRRLGVDRFVVEQRDRDLGLRWSDALTPTAFRLRPDGTRLRTSGSLYAVDGTGTRPLPPTGAVWGTIGATRAAWVGVGGTSFEEEHDGDARTLRGPFPGGSFAGWGYVPAYESAAGVFVAGNVDFTPVIGWFRAQAPPGEALAWIRAPRSGGAGVPYGDAGAVGTFTLGVEIPLAVQPLRYWGCAR